MRKFHEIKLLLASRGMAEIPVIGNVYLLARGVARLFNSGKLAGCVVSDTLLAQCEKYAAGPDKGRAFFRELAAKQLAVFRGLGFAAGYLGGIAKLETFGQIIDLAEGYAADDWREFIKEIQFSQPDEFSSSSTIPRQAWEAPIVSIRNSSPRWLIRRNRKRSRSTIGCRASCMPWPSPAAKGFTA